MENAEIGIIGGTGVYDPKLLEESKQIEVKTPFGPPSGKITLGILEGRKIAFLPRHGYDHSIPPHKINFKANIHALKELGVEKILATCACGSLKEGFKPGEIVIPDQFIDFGKEVFTFYDTHPFYHVSLADPFCPELRELLIKTAEALGIKHQNRGTYLRISGPQLSTKAASNTYIQFADLIGMTGVPEAILAREKEICFAIVATVTDYDSWIGKPTKFSEIKEVVKQNLHNTQNLLKEATSKIPKERTCSCKSALEGFES